MSTDEKIKNVLSNAGEVLQNGFDNAKQQISSYAIEQKKFIKDFIEICLEGYRQGWHERNGGNLTYRLTSDEAESVKAYFSDKNPWIDMGVENNELANSYFISTASGAHMKNMKSDMAHSCGIVQINEKGSAYRIVWGLEDGARPTSEFPSHYLNHCVRSKKTKGSSRVIYHAHPANLISLTAMLPVDAKEYTRVLWKVMTECVVIFPEGVGVLPWMMPGGSEIALATSKLMNNYKSVIWYQHGIFCAGDTLDEAYGLLHTIEKAAEIYLKQCILRNAKKDIDFDNSKEEFLNSISDENLLSIAKEFKVEINKDFLNL